MWAMRAGVAAAVLSAALGVATADEKQGSSAQGQTGTTTQDQAKTTAGEQAKAMAPATHAMMTPSEIKWEPASDAFRPGAKRAVLAGDPSTEGAFTLRMKMPNGYVIRPHWHPTDEHVTVISGKLTMGTGDEIDRKAAKTLTAGGFAVVPRGEHHYAIASGDTVVQVQGMGPFAITYVNPADDPRNEKNRPQARRPAPLR